MKEEEKKERPTEQQSCDNCANLVYAKSGGFICVLSDKGKQEIGWCVNWEYLPF